MMCDHHCNRVYPGDNFYHDYHRQHVTMSNHFQKLNQNNGHHNFYHHYLQQHAILSNYFQRLHQNNNYTDYNNPINVHDYRGHEPYHGFLNNSCQSLSESYSQDHSYKNEEELYEDVEDYDEELCEDVEDYDEEDDSEYGYELNVDAILAMRAAKEELKKESSNDESRKESSSEHDSFVYSDSDKEEFVFVDSSNIKDSRSKLLRLGNAIDKPQEEENKKKFMEFLFGDKHMAIAGFEAAMALNFEHLSDIHQPPMWPVLPLRL